MIVENINKLIHRPRVLVSALDWGLGHATRCIPVISVLIEHDVIVFIAAEDPVASLLKAEFPSIVILRLQGYRIKYSRRKSLLFASLLLQIPKGIFAIKHEKKWLKEMISEHKIDAVISDNRFGLHHSSIPCVFITHQLSIPAGNRFFNAIAQKINYKYINKFSECWIPDSPDNEINLAGELSHPKKLPATTVKYIGALSRFRKKNIEKKYSLLIILSGPEPQRTIFENILLEQIKTYPGKVILVRGLPGNDKKLPVVSNNLTIYPHLPAHKLDELIQQSQLIIARCGYSTVMDLVTLQQKAILVATPGQTEQEYLAEWLMKNKIFYTVSQDDFSLEAVLNAAREFNYSFPVVTFRRELIEAWIGEIKSTKLLQ